MGKLQEFISKTIASKRFNLIAFSVITVMVLIAYSNTFNASFHFDDHPSIVDNSAIRHISGDNILSILQGSRPVVYLSIMLNYQLSGVNVVGWHIFNIGTHVINSILVYLLILWTLTLPSFGKAYAEKSKWMALFGALLFGVHPIQTESVTYIISRSELLATCFYLGTFLLFIKWISTTRFRYVIGMLVTATLSMSSKE
jgi:protein O-mannosyl-transferase